MDGLTAVGTATPLHPAYVGMVTLGFLLLFLFPVTKDFSNPGQKRSYYKVQFFMLFGALLGAKLAVLMGDALWPLHPFHEWEILLRSGRSLVGALLFGFLAAEVAKRAMHYTLPPNDRFAVVLPFSIGIGRFGCYLTGCCLGTPYEGLLSISYDDHVHRHPTQLYEMGFHFACGLIFLSLYRRKILTGRLFALYLVLYGLFRFMTEYIRITEKAFWGYSAYQLFAIAIVLVGMVTLYLRKEQHSSAYS